MSEPTATRYDEEEIDLFELLETLWAGKLVILATTVLPLIAGLGLLLTSTPLFEVKVPYSVHVAPMDAYDYAICTNEGCRKTIVANRAVSLANGEWRSVDGGSALALTTTSPRSVAEYQSDLEALNQTLRTNMLSEAEAESDFFENEIDGDLRQIEVVARSMLRAKRVIFLLERADTPLAFGTISISEVKNSAKPYVLFPAIFGAILGSVFVLFRKALRDRQVAKGQIGG